MERIEEFKAWGNRTDTSLSPLFETREVDSMHNDQTCEAVVLPMMCLAEYRDGDVEYVAPCLADGTVRTIPDYLETLKKSNQNVIYTKTTSD